MRKEITKIVVKTGNSGLRGDYKDKVVKREVGALLKLFKQEMTTALSQQNKQLREEEKQKLIDKWYEVGLRHGVKQLREKVEGMIKRAKKYPMLTKNGKNYDYNRGYERALNKVLNLLKRKTS